MSNAKTYLKTMPDTWAIRMAIATGDSTVYIPDIGQPWLVWGTINLLSNQTIQLQGKCVIKADPAYSWGLNEPLFLGSQIENVKIIGYRATLDMAGIGKADSEWRHALCFHQCKNVYVAGLTINEPGGDGVYLGYGCQGVLINQVLVQKSWRNGISITGATDAVLRYCFGEQCGVGNSAKCFVDIEPNEGEVVGNVLVDKCYASDPRPRVPTTGFNVRLAQGQHGLITIQYCGAANTDYGFGATGFKGTMGNIVLNRCYGAGQSNGMLIQKEVSIPLAIKASTFKGDVGGSVFVYSEPGDNIEHLGGVTFDRYCRFLSEPKLRQSGPLPVEKVLGLT